MVKSTALKKLDRKLEEEEENREMADLEQGEGMEDGS